MHWPLSQEGHNSEEETCKESLDLRVFANLCQLAKDENAFWLSQDGSSWEEGWQRERQGHEKKSAVRGTGLRQGREGKTGGERREG